MGKKIFRDSAADRFEWHLTFSPRNIYRLSVQLFYLHFFFIERKVLIALLLRKNQLIFEWITKMTY